MTGIPLQRIAATLRLQTWLPAHVVEIHVLRVSAVSGFKASYDAFLLIAAATATTAASATPCAANVSGADGRVTPKIFSLFFLNNP